MALTAQHVERIITFTAERIAEARHSRWTEEDDTSRALRALDRLHVGRSAHARMVTPRPWPHPEIDPDGNMARDHLARQKELAANGWNDLHAIADAWKDHPDYHPDFALHAEEFPDVPTTASKEN